MKLLRCKGQPVEYICKLNARVTRSPAGAESSALRLGSKSLADEEGCVREAEKVLLRSRVDLMCGHDDFHFLVAA
jgi:hypothetical protein